MEVTITVLSMHGIIAKKKRKNKHYISKNKNESSINDRLERVGNDTKSKEELSIVASFHTSNDDECTCQTHVPSLKVPLHSSPSPSSLDHNIISQPVIHWPADTRGRGGSSQALSTLKFIGEFILEDDQIVDTEEDDGEEVPRYQPKTCPISLSIFRNGKMVNVGIANLVINGEEKGENSINVPICNTIKHKTLKKVGNGSKRKHPNMTRIKDDTFQFGIKEKASIRVLVHVTKIPQDQQETLKLISSTNRGALRLSTAKYESSSSTLITAETSYSSVSSSEHQDKVPTDIQVTRPPPQEEEEECKQRVVCGMPYVYFSFRPREDKQEYEEGFYTGELDSNSGVPHGMGTWRSEDGMSLMEGEWYDGHLLRKNNSDGTLDRSWSDIIDPQDQALPKYLEPIQEVEHSMRSSVSGEEEEEEDDDISDSRHKKKVNRRHSCPEPPRLKMNSFVEEVGHKEEKKRTKKKKGRKPKPRQKSISSCEEDDETTSPDNLCQPCR